MSFIKHKYFWELFFCTLGSALGGWLVAEISWYTLKLGDRYDLLNGIFVGIPLSCILILWALRKYAYKERPVSFTGIIAGLVISLLGLMLCLFLVDMAGNIMFITMPIVAAIVFNATSRIKKI